MKTSSPIIWRLCLIILSLLLLAGIGKIWLSGEEETADAFASGRRLLISLDSGEITGKIISSTEISETPTPPPPPEEEKKKSEDAPATIAPMAVAPVAPEPAPTIAPAPVPPQEEVLKIIEETPEKTEILPPLAKSATPTAAFALTLSEKGDFGAMPKITADGKKPWRYYAKTAEIKSGKPMIAIIVTGLGASKNTTDLALRLPENIDLSLSPYTKNLPDLARSARDSGHEILLDMPMEASDYPAHDSGQLALLVSQDQTGNEARIKKLMAHDFGYIGFVTPQDEVFLSNGELFKSLLQILAGRGISLVIGKPPAKNDTREMVEKGNTASVIADTLIDEELTTTAIAARLSLLEQTAKQRGYAVGIAGIYPITIKQLGDWAAKAEANGFILVPVSVIISKHFS